MHLRVLLKNWSGALPPAGLQSWGRSFSSVSMAIKGICHHGQAVDQAAAAVIAGFPCFLVSLTVDAGVCAAHHRRQEGYLQDFRWLSEAALADRTIRSAYSSTF